MRGMFLVALALALTGAGCDNSSSGDTTPTTIPGPQTTETFSGMVDPGGIDIHNFTIMQPGEIDVPKLPALLRQDGIARALQLHGRGAEQSQSQSRPFRCLQNPAGFGR